MRRHLAVFVLFATALLLAATPKPLATPVPAPTVAPTLPGTIVPVVMVYPFEAPSDLDPRYGTAIAQIYAQVISQTGGVRVLAIPSGIQRVDYQKYAHVQHADYYISGYIQPIGQAAAIVTQVVDVSNDISVYSATTNIIDVNDVASQALTSRQVILTAAGVTRPELNAGPANTPTPANTSGASVPLSNVLADLFHGKSKTKATPAPGPTEAKPSRGVLIVRLSGNSPAAALTSGTADLYRAMTAFYKTTMSNATATDIAKSADTICGAQRDNTIASGTLNVQHVGGIHAHDSYTFTLNIYACFGPVLYTVTQTDNDFQKAILEAVDAYHNEHADNT